jgi:hypothetical protein
MLYYATPHRIAMYRLEPPTSSTVCAEVADPGPATAFEAYVRDMLETKLSGLGRVAAHCVGSRLAELGCRADEQIPLPRVHWARSGNDDLAT